MSSFWETLNRNLNMETSEFNIDFDGYNKQTVKRIIDNYIKTLPFIEEIKIYRNVLKYKHYHITVKLKKPIPIWQTIIIRVLACDHNQRLSFDLIRLANNITETFDYVGDKKFEFVLQNNNVRLVGEYKPIKL